MHQPTPLATAVQPAPTAQKRPSRVAATARVLLVEDEPVTAEVFARALERAGHEVRVASDGNRALHALRDHAPDIVVLDLGLPTVPGIEVLRRLRDSEHRSIPVIVVSGASIRMLKAGHELIEPGCWLEKPLRPAELVRAVEEQIGF